MQDISLDTVRAALHLAKFDSLNAHARMSPDRRHITPPNDAREAGVLALLYPSDSYPLNIVLTLRPQSLRGHSGQVSFPGGRRDPEDDSYTATALRETCEELGICSGIEVLGTLTQIYIPPSNFHVYPTVGYLPYDPIFLPNPVEVEEVFSVPLWMLLDARYKAEETRTFQNMRVRVPYYELCGHKVWGATAVMLSEFEHRLRAAMT